MVHGLDLLRRLGGMRILFGVAQVVPSSIRAWQPRLTTKQAIAEQIALEAPGLCG